MVTAAIPAVTQHAKHGPARYEHSWLTSTLAAPSLFAALCFAAGILVSRLDWFLPGIFFVVLLMTLSVALVAVLRAPRTIWITSALVYLLLGVFCAEVAPAVDQQPKLARLTGNSRRSIEGTIIRLGAVRNVVSVLPFSDKTREEHSQQFDLHMQSVGTARLTVYAPIDQPFPQLSCNDEVRAGTALHQEERFLDPGVWNAREYFLEQGIGALGSVSTDRLVILATSRKRNLSCWIHSVQQSASSRLVAFAADPHNQRLPSFLRIDQEDASMLTAMITGDRTWLEHQLRIGFERTGSFHLLVVSGLHLAIFAGLIFWIASRLRLSRLWSTLITITLSLCYAVFTGFGHPVQRSFWMVTLYLVGRLFWRDRSALNAIGFAALVMLAATPRSLFDSGLQMTLLSVLAVAGVVVPLAEKSFAPLLRALHNLRNVRIDTAFPPRMAQFRVTIRLIAQHLRPLMGSFLAWKVFPFTLRLLLQGMELLAASTVIELFMMLPMAVYFHRITLFALPVNVLIVPFLGIFLPCALLTFAVLLLAPGLTFLPGAATAIILHSVTRIVTAFASLRAADIRIPMPSPLTVALWIGLTSVTICVIRIRRYGVTLAAAFLGLAAFLLFLPRSMQYRPGKLEVSVIDVGQGDSILVVTPEGKTLLVDAGGLVDFSPNSNFDIGEDVVSPVLWSRGIRRLDAVALTHAHEDHIGGMPAVFANFRPRQLWLGPEPDVPVYENLLHSAARAGTHVHHYVAGDSFNFGGVSIQVLSPAPDYQPRKMPTNDDSLVLRLTYSNTSALLEGDAEAPSEERMLAEGHLHADFLKVGHHGSRTSTTPAFLAAVAPTYSAISVGLRNFYGHPRPEVLRELQVAHVYTYRTDTIGMSSFYLDGQHVTTTPWTAER